MASNTYSGIILQAAPPKTDPALVQFLGQHELEHRRIYNRMLLRGLRVNQHPLASKPDAKWFQVHDIMHKGIEKELGLSSNRPLDGVDPWATEGDWYAWHQDHANRHRQIARVLSGV